MDNDPIAKLRAYIDNHLYDYDVSGALWVDISEILDEIEAKYMKLPLGADNLPIRPGQTIYENDREIPGSCVYGVSDKRVYIWDYSNDSLIVGLYASSFTHEKPDAIIDLLEEYSNLLITSTDPKSLRNEYSKKIREVIENG